MAVVLSSPTSPGTASWEDVTTVVPAASETQAGIAELATQAETDAGTDDARIVTPAKLAAAGNVLHDNVAGEIAGVASKGAPVPNDLLIIEDSADGNNKKRVLASSLVGAQDYGQTVTVGKGTSADYATIEDGVAAATALALGGENALVLVYPGDYTENNPITLGTHVSIMCLGLHEQTRMYCSNTGAGQHGIVMGTDTEIHGLQVRDASGAGAAGYYFPNTAHDMELHDCKFRNCDIGYLSEAAAANASVFVRDPHVSGGTCTTVAQCSAGGYMFVDGLVITSGATVTNVFRSDGANSSLHVHNGEIEGALVNRVAEVSNTASAEIQLVHVNAAAEGFFVLASGGTLSLGSTQLENVAGDHLNLANAATVACILNDCYLSNDNVVKGALAFLSGNYQSSVGSTQDGPTALGELWLGLDPTEKVPLSTYTRNTATTGWVSGGVATLGGGLDVDLTAGEGIVSTGTGVISVEWALGSVTVTDESEFWIYCDSTGTLQHATSEPAHDTNILLAAGYAEGGSVVMLSRHVVPLEQHVGEMHEWIAHVVGSIWISGLVTANPAALTLSVSSGSYYNVEVLETTTGANPITFTTWNNDATGWVAATGVTNVPNTQYNDFGVNLAALAGDYAKHGLYACVSGGVTQYHLVYAQAKYALQADAEGAALPAPPSVFSAAAIPLAGIVVDDGVSPLVSIIDHRPAIQTGTAGSAVAASDHGALAGLGDDDHTQYASLAGNAARNAITGTLDISGGGLVVPTAAAPAQTTEGQVVWDSDDDLLTVGDGASRKTMVDTTATQTLTNKTLTAPTIADSSNIADVIHDNVAGEIAAVAVKTTVAGADIVLIEDSAAGNAKKSITVEDLRGGPVEFNTTDTYSDYLVSGLTILTDVNAPDIEILRDSVRLYAFAGTGPNTEQGFFTLHILHDIKAGTTPTLHIHWTHKIAAPSGNVKWQLEITAARGYGAGTFPATTVISSTQAAGAQYTHMITPDTDMPLPAALAAVLEPDMVLICRVFRNPADAADTFANDAFLLQIDMHYVQGQEGTTERNRPFTSAGF